VTPAGLVPALVGRARRRTRPARHPGHHARPCTAAIPPPRGSSRRYNVARDVPRSLVSCAAGSPVDQAKRYLNRPGARLMLAHHACTRTGDLGATGGSSRTPGQQLRACRLNCTRCRPGTAAGALLAFCLMLGCDARPGQPQRALLFSVLLSADADPASRSAPQSAIILAASASPAPYGRPDTQRGPRPGCRALPRRPAVPASGRAACATRWVTRSCWPVSCLDPSHGAKSQK
jgi:hypothetical protein